MDRQRDFEKPAIGDSHEGGLDRFRPSDFMRARHPELFSDSRIVAEDRISPEIFEYHLETLTNRKQETEFEHFCRRLAEKEICPNLLPQTGPTGGGDSKADAETYPVADDLAIRWYEGVGREASRERWAFAFSTKKAWPSKVRSDVQEIAATNRGYQLIYFITNQFARDKKRAEIEDQLGKKFNIRVVILDRMWIKKCIFEHDRIRLAVETLGLREYDETRTITGPRDMERKGELDDLEKQIKDPDRYQGTEYQLGEDCLQAALLARDLELPKVEVIGRFERAQQVAERVGIRQLRLHIAYFRAWTVYWWYEDYKEFSDLYDRVEELAANSSYADNLEMLTNLWMILFAACRLGRLDPLKANLDKRTNALRAPLEALAKDMDRPNNALMARMHLLVMDLIQRIHGGETVDTTIGELKRLLIKGENLPGFRFKTLSLLISEMSDTLFESSAYDELFDLTVTMAEKRAGQGEAGRMLLDRAFSKLETGKKYDAIRLFGQSMSKMAMNEYRRDWISAIVGCGLAYEAAGLLWAARANVLMAASHVMEDFLKGEELAPLALTCVQKLVWLELQLGRPFAVLSWMEMASILAKNMALESGKKDEFLKERDSQDMVLGLLLLKTDVWELKWLDFLPEVLERMGLHHSWMALLYALGYEDYLRSQGAIPDGETADSVRSLFNEWIHEPACSDLPDHPELMRGQRIAFRSYVLGCEIIFESDNAAASIGLAEILLGAIEALLATSIDTRIAPYQPELHVWIEFSDLLVGAPECEVKLYDPQRRITIRHGLVTPTVSRENLSAFRDRLLEIILTITCQMAIIDDVRAFGDRLCQEERAFERALNYSDTPVAIRTILGEEPKFSPSQWNTTEIHQRFVLRRNLPWYDGLSLNSNDEVMERPIFRLGTGEPPAGLFGVDSLKHRDLRVLSLLDVPLWGKAKWKATAYMWGGDLMPAIALGFEDAEAAQQIFKGLQSRLGAVDEREQLRVAIITGIDKEFPSSYKVVISTNVSQMIGDKDKQLVLISRVHRMDPPDSKNLDAFLKLYKRAHKYVILPAIFVESSRYPKVYWDLKIEKTDLSVRPAWQIGENDPDVVAIGEEDRPVIPSGMKNPPVISALKRFDKFGPRKR